jgi:hypothetical protein
VGAGAGAGGRPPARGAGNKKKIRVGAALTLPSRSTFSTGASVFLK